MLLFFNVRANIYVCGHTISYVIILLLGRLAITILIVLWLHEKLGDLSENYVMRSDSSWDRTLCRLNAGLMTIHEDKRRESEGP